MDNILDIINQYSVFIIIGLAVIVLLLFIITMVLLSAVNKLENKYRKMMRGGSNKSLEKLITDNLDKIEDSVNNSSRALEICEGLKKDIDGCVNKVAIMRYKAFEDVGSDLSYSIAILDSHNDGVVLTGIYSRHDSTTYAKPIDKGISRYELSEEEIQVLNEAMNSK